MTNLSFVFSFKIILLRTKDQVAQSLSKMASLLQLLFVNTLLVVTPLRAEELVVLPLHYQTAYKD